MVLPHELVVDLYAGGGGASEGIEQALGRPVDIAVNHSPAAIAVHRVNHPGTKHYLEDIWRVDPVAAVGGRPVGLLWASPDCTSYSRAKGGKPVRRNLRVLPYAVIRWAKLVRPRLIMLENVEEYLEWSPLDAKNKPIKARKGERFRAWKRKLESYGYVVEHRLLVAADYGAPTTRRRLFLIARCDGRPIVWPEPTHGKGRARPWRAAAECIDWALPCPSIFDRPRPLAEATLRRIAAGIRKYVLGAARPFVVPLCHTRSGPRVHASDAPLPTVPTAKGGEFALCQPFVVPAKTHGGGGNGARSAAEPLRTVTCSKRGEFALAAPLLTKYHGDVGRAARVSPAQEPLRTADTTNRFGLATAFLAPVTHQGDARTHDAREPVRTVTAAHRGELAVVTSFLARTDMHQANAGCVYDPGDPLRTITTGGGFAVVEPVLAPVARPGVPPCATRDHGRDATAHAGVPFVMTNTTGHAPRGCDAPLATVTTCDHHYLAVPTLIQTGYSERDGQAPRVPGLQKPLGTVVAAGQKHALVAAFLNKHYGGVVGQPAERPLGTVTAIDHHSVTTCTLAKAAPGPVAAFLARTAHGEATADGHRRGRGALSAEEPCPTVTTSGDAAVATALLTKRDPHAAGAPRAGQVAAFLTKFYGTAQAGVPVSANGRGGGHMAQIELALEPPAPEPDAEAVGEAPVIWLDGEAYVLADIGLRMLQPHELFAAQGFPADYQIQPELAGKPLTKTAQITLAGNSVPPQLAAALVAANCGRAATEVA
jgi:DNA (cytosine-5)-methyltransferase 1